MAGNQVPNNLEDKTVLKRFLTDLVLGLNANPYYSGNVTKQQEAIIEVLASNPSLDFLNIVTKINELQTTIKTYVEDELETIILQNKEDVAVIAEQFGTFYDQALATSWYGLSVKAGGVVAGIEVGSLDPDVTTPGDESSYFRISADNFVVGRAYEDLSQAEKDYLAANNLPAFGTVYNASKQPVPAFAITWDSINQVYKHYFNGIVNFSNIDTGYKNINGSTEIDGSMLRTGTVIADSINGNEINGLVINGGIINGARINGAVIKASYLDLDGELEVLTNYHISVATYNTNPSLYTDAVYISTDNEYRIPSMSTITGPNLQGFYTPASFPYSPRSYTSNIYAYNIANVGSNNKAVKPNPTINFNYSGRAGGTQLFYGRNSIEFYIKIGSMYLIRCIWGGNGSSCTVSGMGPTVVIEAYSIGHYYALGIDFTVQKYATNGSVSVQDNFSFTLPSTWNTAGGITTGCIGGEIATLYHPKITINNMI